MIGKNIFSFVYLFLFSTLIIAQDSNKVIYSMFLESTVSIGTINTKVAEGEFKEGDSFIIPAAELTGDFAVYQDLYNALVGGVFGIEYGALDKDIEMKIFIRNLDPQTGTYKNYGSENDTLFSYFEIRIWEYPHADNNYYPEDSSYYFNDGYHANFSLPKSDALLHFLDLVGIDRQDSLGFAFMEDVNKPEEDWNGFGISTIDETDSIRFQSIHLSRIGGGRRRIAERNYYSSNVNSINIDRTGGIPSRIEMNQNYPNPFNPSTIISYSISNPDMVSLKVYDVMGRFVGTLVNEFQPAGNYKVQFNASDLKGELSSGIYFYVLQSNNFLITKKMVLTK